MADLLPQRRHVPMSERQSIWVLRALVALGVISLLVYFSWWRGGGRIASPWLGMMLTLASLYSWTQILGVWTLYLAARRRPSPPPPGELTIDVFVTACKEPLALIERSLAAACAMRGPHRTWLLDDGGDPALAALAERLGAGYLTRTERTNAKAGNLNAALARTTGDIVVIFDVDHAPTRDFLERSVGYFADPAVGFVQVMLTFGNGVESWVARAAAESSVDYYNPTALGMDALGSATLVGSNALIRRAALRSIGGYQPGLAEDLATSIALHAAGWRSVYVAEPLAPGLAPTDLTAWFTQQLKWARGVFEVLLLDYPRLFPRLTWGQRLSYGVRTTYYWLGPVISIHLLFTVARLFSGSRIADVDLRHYLLHLFPVMLFIHLIRKMALWTWSHPSVESGSLWRAVALVFATWPVYTVAWVLAVLRIPVAFRPTPKTPTGALHPLWLLPQTLALLLLGAGVYYSFAIAQESQSLLVLCFAFVQGGFQVTVLWQWLREPRLRPWFRGRLQLMFRPAPVGEK